MDARDTINRAQMTQYSEQLLSARDAARQRYKLLDRVPFHVTSGDGDGYAETYPSWESGGPNDPSPKPGEHVIQVRDKKLTPDQIEELIAAESLHWLAGRDPETGEPVDKKMRGYKDAFINSLTPEQLTFERMQYQHHPDEHGVQGRSFGDWFEQSRADAYIRGKLFPNLVGNQGWDQEGLYSPDQERILGEAKQYMQQGQ